MKNLLAAPRDSRHLRITEPSPWVRRFAPLVPAGAGVAAVVLDLACGNGRHARLFLSLGHHVVALDRNAGPVADLADDARAEVIEADLEAGASVFGDSAPLAGRTFAGIVVVNYLYRPLFPALLDALAPGGVLIYETFARGNERFTRPRNPDHLLGSGELLQRVAGRLQVVAYEHGLEEGGQLPGVKQRISAVNDLENGEPPVHPLQPA